MNKRQIGSGYEEQAAEFLQRAGMQILHRNFRTRAGEIDLVARDGSCLVFVEVKYRRDSRMGTALEAVDLRKQGMIIKTARYYLLRFGYSADTPCRFDVVGITGNEITYVKDAFWAG